MTHRPFPTSRVPVLRFAGLSVLVAVLLAVVTACGPGSPPDLGGAATDPSPTAATGAEDEAAVRGLLDKINEAWARGDATSYASYHAPDADLIDFRGIHAAGRDEIIALMQPAFDTVLKNTRVEARIVALRFLGPDVALFHTEGRIVPTGAPAVQTFVTIRTDDGWQIAAFQNTRIAAER